MKIRLIVLLVLSSFLLSCSGPKEKVYEKNGISFSYPGNWGVKEDIDYGDGSYYLSIERKGYDESGLVVFAWVKSDVESSIEEMLEASLDFLRESDVIENLVISPVTPVTLNGISGIYVSYTMSIQGIMPHTGKFYLLENENWKVSFLQQEADEDAEKNKAGFKLIESTFELN